MIHFDTNTIVAILGVVASILGTGITLIAWAFNGVRKEVMKEERAKQMKADIDSAHVVIREVKSRLTEAEKKALSTDGRIDNILAIVNELKEMGRDTNKAVQELAVSFANFKGAHEGEIEK